MFRATVIVFGAILSHYFLPWMTLADIPPNHSNNYDSPTTLEQSRRLDELVDLRAKDVKRIGDLVVRVTELEDLRANDMRSMTRKIQQLEDSYTKDKLQMTRRVAQLEQRRDSGIRNVLDAKNTQLLGSQRGVRKADVLNRPNVLKTDYTKFVQNENAPSSAVTVDGSDVMDSSNLETKDAMYSTRLSGSPTLEDGRNPRAVHTRSSTVGHWNSTSLSNITPIKGANGEKGAPGHVGPKGNKGDLGPTGHIGLVGPRGLRGPPGQNGGTGASGGPGPKGDIGPVGPGGPPGQKGGSGASGSSVNAIAFHAFLSVSLMDPRTDQVIKYNQVITNVGSNYDPHTGIFTCTHQGVYVFSWSTLTGNPQWINTDLVRNGDTFAYSTVGDNDHWTTGSATAAIQLAVGDKVWVRVGGHSNGADIYEPRTMFTGFRIYDNIH